MKDRRNKLSISISQNTLDRVEELRRIVNLQAIDNKEKMVSLSRIVEEMIQSGLDNRGKELWV